MLRKTACAAAGLTLACAAAYSLALMAQPSATELDLRWLYTPASPAKADRLPVTQRPPSGDMVVAFDDQLQATTVVRRVPPSLSRESAVRTPRPTVRTIPVRPVREVPNEEPDEQVVKEKLPEGCEPAFSPVTTPAFAHIGVRCDS